MKRIFLLCGIIMALGLVSCSNDDEPKNNGTSGNTSSFVGTWEMTTSGVLGDGEGNTYMQIASDHTFILVNDYGYDDVEVSYGTWKNTNDTFTLNYKIFHGADPMVPTVTYMIESMSSKSFVLSLSFQNFTFTKVSDSVMDKYRDEIEDVIGDESDNYGDGSSSSLTLNGTTISRILSSAVEGNTFVSQLWYDNFVFDFEFRYIGKISNLTSGDNITDKIDILTCESLNIVLIDGSYEIISGSVRVDSKTSDSIKLNYSNLKIQQYIGSSEGNVYTINGKISYSL